MAHAVGECVEQVHVHETGQHACSDERGRVFALDPQHQIAYADDEALNDADAHIKKPASEIGLRCRESWQACWIDAETHDSHEDESAHPKRQVAEERRYARAVRVDGVKRDRIELYRGRHERRNIIGIHAKQGGEFFERGGILERAKIGVG